MAFGEELLLVLPDLLDGVVAVARPSHHSEVSDGLHREQLPFQDLLDSVRIRQILLR